jgi:putative ABC transport system substrate-binding protein
MMDSTSGLRRRPVVVGALAATIAPHAVWSQATRAGPPRKVGYLGAGPKLPREHPFWVQWFKEMETLGWVEGKNLAFDYRVANGDPTKIDGAAVELAKQGCDLFLIDSDASVMAALRASSTVPIVVAFGGDPVAFGYAKSLGRPGGRVTGMLYTQSINIVQKSAQVLKELVPGLTRCGAIRDTVVQGLEPYIDAFSEAGSKLGFRQELVAVTKPEDHDAAFAELGSRGCQAVLMYGSANVYIVVERVVALARKYRMADMHIIPEAVDLGGLASWGPDLVDMFRRSAAHVDKILKGANPGDLPLQQPLKYDLVLNAKTAKERGFTIPVALRHMAERIVE